MEREQRRTLAKGVLIACFVLGAAALLVQVVNGPNWSARGTYRIGWEDDAPDQVLGVDGQPTGLAIELVREAARRRGIALRWVLRNESSEAALRSGAVDLWPLMVITSARRKVLHLTEPYLDSVISFMVLRSSPWRSLTDLSGRAIGYRSQPINYQLAHQYLPDSPLIGQGSAGELMESLCQHKIAGVFIEQEEVSNAIMGGASCKGEGFAMITIPNSRIRLGMGSTLKSSDAADAIRDELDVMAADGRLAGLFTKWGYLSGRSVTSIEALLALRSQQRWSRAAAGLFALLFLLSLWQTSRYRRESTRARLAETALRHSMQEARQMEEQLRLLAHALRSAGECISITDTNGRILYANDAFLRTYEYSESALVGQSSEVLLSAHPDRAVPPDVAAAITGGGWRGELWNRGKSGREFPVVLSTSPVRDDDGTVIATVCVASDITSRRQAEKEHQTLQAQYLQAQKMEVVGRLAGGIAHDFNNLLTIINGYSDLALRRLDAADPVRSFAEQIRNAGERAAGLTNQLLAFSRKQVFQPAILDLNAIVREAAPMLQRLIGEDITLGIHLDEHLGMVVADRDQIHQIVMNMAVNARDAMASGGKLEIGTMNVEVNESFIASSSQQARPGHYVLLTITDSGQGMDEAIRQKIFEPFFTTKGPGKGTGLGLSTAYGIVEQSGGWIDVWSELGVGTLFQVYLPRSVESGKPVEALAVGNVADGGSETVLLVEDQEAVRSFARVALLQYGYHIIEASGGDEAIALAKEYSGEIDLLLTDVVLTGMNGRELAEQLTVLRPTMKVLFASGYTSDVLAGRGVLDDRVAFLHKPFSPEGLAAKVRETLRAGSESANRA